VSQVVNPESIGEARASHRLVPDLASEVGVAEWLSLQRREDQRVRMHVHLSGEVFSQKVAEEVIVVIAARPGPGAVDGGAR